MKKIGKVFVVFVLCIGSSGAVIAECSSKNYGSEQLATAMNDIAHCETMSDDDRRRVIGVVVREKSAWAAYSILREFLSLLSKSERDALLEVVFVDPEHRYFSLVLEFVRLDRLELKKWIEEAAYRISDSQMCFNVLVRTVNKLADNEVYMLANIVRLRGAIAQAIFLLKNLPTQPLSADAREELVDMIDEKDAKREAKELLDSPIVKLLEPKLLKTLRRVAGKS